MKSVHRYSALVVVALAAAMAASGSPRWQTLPGPAGPAESTVALPPATVQVMRPRYQLRADIDFDLLTFRCDGIVTVPVRPGDSMSDVVFFVFANAAGVGGADEHRKNIVVDSVKLAGTPLVFSLKGAVLRVQLPVARTQTFDLALTWRGVVPRSPADTGGLSDLMGGDIGDVLGGSTTTAKPKNIDYGLYTYGGGVLSMGAFWYPTLAMRRNHHWIDEAPEGLGDVAYAEMSDYDVTFGYPAVQATAGLTIVTPADDEQVVRQGSVVRKRYTVSDVRDFATVMSDDFVKTSRPVKLNGRLVNVLAYTTRRHEGRAEKITDIAAHALAIYSDTFGPYPYASFKVVEGPLKAGAGGMEYSGMTTIASALYDDLAAQLGGLATAMGAPGVSDADLQKIIGDDDAPSPPPTAQHQPASPAPATEAAGQSPAGDLLGSILGNQKAMLDSLLEMTIAHETAHQWWAIGVGSDSQRAPWLDESLTNYSAIIYFEKRYGPVQGAKMEDINLKTSYSMGRMLGLSDAPVASRTSAFKNNMQYGAVVYGKGALYYGALRKLVGDTAFFGALKAYFHDFDDHLATESDLCTEFQRAAPAQAAAIAGLETRWIHEQHGDDDVLGGPAQSLADMFGGLLGGGAADQ